MVTEDISGTVILPTPRSPGPLPSGRTRRPGCPAGRYLGAPPARLEPHLHRPSCCPPARAGVIGTACLLRFSSRRNHGLPGFSFLAISHPSRTPNQESSIQARLPGPSFSFQRALPAPVSHLPQLMCPVAHGGRSAPSPDLSPEGLKVLSLEVLHLSLTLDTPFLTLRTPAPPRASKGPTPFTIHCRREEPDHRTPKFYRLEFPSLPPILLPQLRPRPSADDSEHAHEVLSLPR